MLKTGFPKIPSTRSLSKEKSSQHLQIFRHFCILRKNEGKKMNALGVRWKSDKGRHKKGGEYCVQVSGSHSSAESYPLRGLDSDSVPVRLGTKAAAALGLGPVGESS